MEKKLRYKFNMKILSFAYFVLTIFYPKSKGAVVFKKVTMLVVGFIV